MSLHKILKKILDDGYITGSKIPKSVQSSVDQLVAINALELNILKRGSRYSMGNEEIFRAEISVRYPEGLESVINFDSESSRYLGVKSQKDAKLSRKRYATVQVFVMNPALVIVDDQSVPKGIERFSLSVLVDSLSDWHVSGNVILVENQEPFLRSPLLFGGATMIICYNGRVNLKVSEWLCKSKVKVTICPDYDPVGLDEYWKLKSMLKDNLEIFLPDSITEDFKYSTIDLLNKKKNREVLQRLANIQSLDEPGQKILSLIQKWNSGLMQEIYFKD